MEIEKYVIVYESIKGSTASRVIRCANKDHNYILYSEYINLRAILIS